jgi:hypothetical protein
LESTVKDLTAERFALSEKSLREKSHMEEKLNQVAAERDQLLEEVKDSCSKLKILDSEVNLDLSENMNPKLNHFEDEKGMKLHGIGMLAESLAQKLRSLEADKDLLLEKLKTTSDLEEKIHELKDERDKLLKNQQKILDLERERDALKKTLANLEVDKVKLLDRAKTSTELELRIHELENEEEMWREREQLHQETAAKMKELEKEVRDLSERISMFAKEEAEWRSDKESYLKLIKEQTTWAKDLRSTLQEVEKTKELDRSNFRRQLDSLKQDNTKELAEVRSQLTEARSQLTEAWSQLERVRAQIVWFPHQGETKNGPSNEENFVENKQIQVRVSLVA